MSSEIIAINKRTYAIIIAIENYRTPKGSPTIPSVAYALNDANNFRDMLVTSMEVEPSDITMWVDQEAMRTTLENDLPYHLRTLTQNDRFIFYYAGHGFYKDGHNWLTTWDSHPFNLDGTTVSIKDVLLDPLEATGCQESLIFLDCCASELYGLGGARDVISDLSDKEFDDFVKTGKYSAIFMSCSPGEKSYGTSVLNAGVWTWHVAHALRGNDGRAIVRDKYITDNSLRNYLSLAVPDFITKQTTIRGSQTPIAKISAGKDFVISKIPDEVVERDKSLPNLKLLFEDAMLRKIAFMKIKNASGFNKGYSVPKFRNSTTKSFVQKVFSKEINDELQEVYQNTKTICGLKRNEIQYAEAQDGGGSVDCKYFRFNIYVEQDEKDITQAKVTRTITLRVNRHELPERFDDIFPQQIDELVIPIEGRVDFDGIINQFENLQEADAGSLKDNPAEGTLEYITNTGTSIKVDTYNNELIITHYRLMKTLELIDRSLEDIKRISDGKIRLLA